MIPLWCLFLVGMMLGTRGWNSSCEPQHTIKKSSVVYLSSCESDWAVCLKELLVADAFGLKAWRGREKGGNYEEWSSVLSLL